MTTIQLPADDDCYQLIGSLMIVTLPGADCLKMCLLSLLQHSFFSDRDEEAEHDKARRDQRSAEAAQRTSASPGT